MKLVSTLALAHFGAASIHNMENMLRGITGGAARGFMGDEDYDDDDNDETSRSWPIFENLPSHHRNKRQIAAEASNQATNAGSMFGLNTYGCWCYFGSNIDEARGPPQDPFDRLCKVLVQGYECAVLDARDEGRMCIPWEVEYKTVMILPTTNVPVECSRVNKGNTCAERACIVETTFMISLQEKLFQFQLPKDKFKHDSDRWNQSVCHPTEHASWNEKIIGLDRNGMPIEAAGEMGLASAHQLGSMRELNNKSNERLCCGDYPTRYPYHTKYGSKACCAGKTYNSAILLCCEDGRTDVVC